MSMNRVIEKAPIKPSLSWQMFAMAAVIGAAAGCAFFAVAFWFFRTVWG